jgi:hypothetical protein
MDLYRNRIRWFKIEEDSSISVIVWYAWHFDKIQDQTRESKAMAYLSDTYAGLFAQNPPIDDLKITTTLVDGTSATAISLTIPKWHEYHFWGIMQAVCFEREGYIWVISILHDNRTTLQPSPHFEHLIQTFKITGSRLEDNN